MRQGAFASFGHLGLTEEPVCQNFSSPLENGGEVERGESEAHVLPGGLGFGCGSFGQCANSPPTALAPVKVLPAADAPALQVSETPDQVGIAGKHGLPQPPLILPDGSEMTWLTLLNAGGGSRSPPYHINVIPRKKLMGKVANFF